MNRAARAARWALPFVVSGGVLAFLLMRIDARGAMQHLTASALWAFVPVLLLFGLVSFFLEGVSLQRLLPNGHSALQCSHPRVPTTAQSRALP